MVFEGLPFDEAARKQDFTVRAMRYALERPHVIRYLREQKQVFRASASSQNISRLVAIRDQGSNAMAQLGAIKLLEQVDEQEERKGAVRTPGVTIVIATGEQSLKSVTIDAQPSAKRAIGVPFGGESGGEDGAA